MSSFCESCADYGETIEHELDATKSELQRALTRLNGSEQVPDSNWQARTIPIAARSLVISYDDFYELRRRADAYERVQQQALLVQSTLLGLWDPAPDAPRPRGMNGKDWADAFALTFPRCGVPDGLMVGWFANAIQAGYDSAVIRYGHVADRADRLQRRLDLFTAARDALAALKHDPEQLG